MYGDERDSKFGNYCGPQNDIWPHGSITHEGCRYSCKQEENDALQVSSRVYIEMIHNIGLCPMCGR